MKCSVIVAAAGSGKRLGRCKNKVLLDFGGEPLLSYCLKIFDSVPVIEEIIITAAGGEEAELTAIGSAYIKQKPFKMVLGGKERQDSVLNGIKAVSPDSDVILIHDGARPFVTVELTEKLISAVADYDGALPVHPVKETVKRGEGGLVKETVPRRDLYLAQTPQVFKAAVLKAGYEKATLDQITLTDDCGAVEYIGGTIALIDGGEENIKITTPFDWEYGEYLMKRGK